MTKTIEVEVFGHRFSLQGEGDEAYFHELAEYVDTQMRTLAKQTKTSTPTKLAILAAINVTDELFRQQRHRESGETEMERRAQLLVERIDEHLETPPS
ncbi:MAG: cell division protein ZapA [Nitrospirota bacterium]|jgi:cell division protein ZapA|nr:cell division protein ZapA [Nitrospirota bacterium]MDX2420632.1 cell division protein ZapA [Nitrospirota bacterium]